MVYCLFIIHSIYDNWRIGVRKLCKRLYRSKCFLPESRPLSRHFSLTKDSDMRWTSNILCYIARQSSILSMPTEGFVSARSSSFFSLIFYWCCAENQKIELQLLGERELLPENSVKSCYQCNLLVTVYGKKASVHLIYSKGALDPRSSRCSVSKLSMCRNACVAQEFKLTGNLNSYNYISQVLRCQEVDKAWDLCLVNTI